MTKEETEAERIIEMFQIETDYDHEEFKPFQQIQCALIHVNGIIEAMEDFVFRPDYEIRKWQRVKAIIETK